MSNIRDNESETEKHIRSWEDIDGCCSAHVTLPCPMQVHTLPAKRPVSSNRNTASIDSLTRNVTKKVSAVLTTNCLKTSSVSDPVRGPYRLRCSPNIKNEAERAKILTRICLRLMESGNEEERTYQKAICVLRKEGSRLLYTMNSMQSKH